MAAWSSRGFEGAALVPMSVTGMPCSSASIPVHFPVPFCPAVSEIFSTSGVPSVSLCARMAAVISIRYESSSPAVNGQRGVRDWAMAAAAAGTGGGGGGGLGRR